MFCFPEDYQATYLFTNSDDLRKAMYKMPYISSNFFKIFNLTFQILFQNLCFTHVYLQCFVAIQFQMFSPFPLQRFEQISTLPFCSAPDKTMWRQYSKGNYSNFKEFQRATTPNTVRTYGMQFMYKILWNVEMSKRSVDQWRPYCLILFLTEQI